MIEARSCFHIRQSTTYYSKTTKRLQKKSFASPRAVSLCCLKARPGHLHRFAPRPSHLSTVYNGCTPDVHRMYNGCTSFLSMRIPCTSGEHPVYIRCTRLEEAA
jgi:hypothetical protein